MKKLLEIAKGILAIPLILWVYGVVPWYQTTDFAIKRRRQKTHKRLKAFNELHENSNSEPR